MNPEKMFLNHQDWSILCWILAHYHSFGPKKNDPTCICCPVRCWNCDIRISCCELTPATFAFGGQVELRGQRDQQVGMPIEMLIETDWSCGVE